MIGRPIHIRPILVGMLLILGMSELQHSCTVNDEWEGYYRDSPERIDDNVLKLIGQNDNYSRFHDALVEYGFEKMLSENQYFTLFVPINAAFEGLPEYSASDWRKIIGFHIVFTKLFSYDFSDRDLLTTIGKYLNMNDTGSNGTTISGSAINPEQVDQYCQNGVIHEIDRLLIPKPNLYEYIMSLDDSYSILKGFLNSMNERYIDYEKSERIGVDDNGNAIYDTVWREENYFLDHIAGLNNEDEAYTGFLPGDESVNQALKAVSGYFGDIEKLDEETYSQLLFITFSGSFVAKSYSFETFPDTVLSVTGKTVAKSQLNVSEENMALSNGIVHLLGSMVIPQGYFLLPIVIECDRKENRTVSNTVYPIEELGDTRASNGSYVRYGCQFVGDYIEFRVNMVLKTTYWVVWTGPKQGPSHYQISVFDESTGNFVNIGPPVNNWTKGWFNLVVSGSYTFDAFGTKRVRITIVDEAPLVGQNSIFVDYIKLIPDEIYEP
jgi:uncharacterized surface protein with fasciclin (FAS1) repeats